MAQINDILSHIDFESMREYCMANGKTVGYAKGDCFTEEGRVGRYAGFVKSGYFKYCVLTEKSDYAVTGFSFAGECVMDFTQSFVSTNLPKYQSLLDVIPRLYKYQFGHSGILLQRIIPTLYLIRQQLFWKNLMNVT